MELNVDKSKVTNFGRTNNRDKYYMEENTLLIKSVAERDLGIMVSKDLSWEVQIDNVGKKANRILGMLKITFQSRDPKCRGTFMFHLKDRILSTL